MDLKQNYASIVPHTLEEAYEVADAIEQGDLDHLKGELGDLLFQVVFYAQLAKEEGRFEFDDVIDGITRKLLRRHPHVFPTGELYAPAETPRLTDEQVNLRWDEIKAEERAEKAGVPEQLSLLDDVPRALPALSRAAKLQKRAAQVGFDWPAALPVVDKVREELDEILEAMVDNDAEGIAEEVGDLLFSVVNLARHLKVDRKLRYARPIASSTDASDSLNRLCATCSVLSKRARSKKWTRCGAKPNVREKSTPGCG